LLQKKERGENGKGVGKQGQVAPFSWCA
jgi:hypothetical protein